MGRLDDLLVHRQQKLTDGDLVALLDMNLLDHTGEIRRHLGGGLLGLQLHDRLVLLHRVAFGDQNGHHLSSFDVLSQLGELHFLCHPVLPSGPFR